MFYKTFLTTLYLRKWFEKKPDIISKNLQTRMKLIQAIGSDKSKKTIEENPLCNLHDMVKALSSHQTPPDLDFPLGSPIHQQYKSQT